MLAGCEYWLEYSPPPPPPPLAREPPDSKFEGITASRGWHIHFSFLNSVTISFCSKQSLCVRIREMVILINAQLGTTCRIPATSPARMATAISTPAVEVYKYVASHSVEKSCDLLSHCRRARSLSSPHPVFPVREDLRPHLRLWMRCLRMQWQQRVEEKGSQ